MADVTTRTASDSSETLRNYFAALLDELDAPHTDQNFLALYAWSAFESGRKHGSDAAYNPLNTSNQTLFLNGSPKSPTIVAAPKGSVIGLLEPNGPTGPHIAEYHDFYTGVNMTAATLLAPVNQQYGYGPIVAALRSGNSAASVLSAVAQSSWGSGSGPLNVLQHSPSTSLVADEQSQDANGPASQGGQPLDEGQVQDQGVLGHGLSVTTWMDGLKAVLAFLTTRSNWIRIGEFTLGVGLVILGLILLFKKEALAATKAALV